MPRWFIRNENWDFGGKPDPTEDGTGEPKSRKRRLATTSSSRSGTASESELYRQARKLLAAEVAACRGIEPEAADAWILEQVRTEHS